MPTDQQISVLVDIASNGGLGLSADKSRDLMEMVAANYAECQEGTGGGYRLTPKGQNFLSARGVGANES